MLKKTITYTNYNGETVTEDFYFNLSKPEIIKMQMSEEGGLDQLLDKVQKSKDSKKIMEIFDKIILKSYGEKSPDGKRFVKSDEISKNFQSSEAYNQLFMELVTDAKKAADFVNAIIPALTDAEKAQVDAAKKQIQTDAKVINSQPINKA